MNENIYFITMNTENTLCVLQRISSVLSRNRINIEQLTVFETANKGISHFNLVVHGTQDKIEKIVKKLANVIEVIDINITNCLPLQGSVISDVPQNVKIANHRKAA
ncbi:acetolactate synthase small subunit [Francisella sp. LA112445]|jgi:acetolactate synthase-1/3 small subunit|uniref:acetolactate synthase small subunit n=1 Tax=Francisella sp. LA112445 TaxID=1395624 RepID=UPI001788AE0B|nr:acetolactate synthase small subunit [Francisella sp. LA112445]QIW09958.1 acetolactate synthase small subunit [Francisella sp. LA112445]